MRNLDQSGTQPLRRHAGYRLALCCFLLAQLIQSTPAKAQNRLTGEQLTSIIREAKDSPMKTGVTVVSAGPAVTVLADRPKTDSDRDLKIDAVFLAKTLVDAAGSQIDSVKVIFSDAGKNGHTITIPKKTIIDYGQARITPDQLLSSLFLLPVQSQEAPKVAAGPLMERRLLVWQRIQKLRTGGTGVAPFENIFKEVETLAGSGKDQDTENRLSYLESKLQEQENILALAKKSARGLGVPGRARTDSSGSASATTAGAPASGAGPGQDYLPPDHEGIKAQYERNADRVLQAARTKSPQSYTQLAALKSQIDECFSRGTKSRAFQLIHQFQIAAMKATGIDIIGPQQGSETGSPVGGPGGYGGPGGDFGPGGEGGPPGGGFGPPGGGPPGGGFGQRGGR